MPLRKVCIQHCPEHRMGCDEGLYAKGQEVFLDGGSSMEVRCMHQAGPDEIKAATQAGFYSVRKTLKGED